MRNTGIVITQIPFLRIVVPFVCGIVIGEYIKPSVWLHLSVVLLNCCVYWMVTQLKPLLRFRFRNVPAFCLLALLVVAGSAICRLKSLDEDVLKKTGMDTAKTKYALIVDEGGKRKRSFKTTVEVWDPAAPASGRLLVNAYFLFSNSLDPPAFGTVFSFRTPVRQIPAAGNPGAFDYRTYCHRNGIAGQLFFRPRDYTIVRISTERSSLRRRLFELRSSLLNILKTHIRDPRNCGLAEALFIGYKQDLDQHLLQSYSNTGVVHVIAISGLHLGLIYLVLNFVLAKIRFGRRNNWITSILLVASLWMFTLLAGASPSIVRSAVMFTVIIVGNTINKQSSLVNNLCSSAFLLLLCNPQWLWDLGFQFSYAALFGLALFSKSIHGLRAFKHTFADQIWKLITSTLAAQIFTTPVTIYFFHQFPIWFLPVNIVAVPLSSGILLAEIALCLASPVASVASVIGSTVDYGIDRMNHIVEFFDRLPFSSLKDLYLNLPQVMLLYMLALGCYLLIHHRRRSHFFFCLVCILSIALMRSFSFVEAALDSRLIVYNLQGKSLVALIHHRHAIICGERSVLNDSLIFYYTIKPSLIELRTKRLSAFPARASLSIISGNRNVIICNSDGSFASAINANDVVVLTDKYISAEKLIRSGKDPFIVFSSSTHSPHKAKVRDTYVRAGLRVHDVADSGAFVMSLN
jgi:competence protein ComEC